MNGAFASSSLIGLASPLGVWALHFAAVYGLQGLACAEGWQRMRIAGIELPIVLLLALTVAALAVIAWLGLRAHRRVRQADAAALRSGADERRGFLATAAVFASLLGAIAVVFTAVPLLMLETCT